MITASVYRDAANRIARVSVAGHADFDRLGQDIVCSAVSVLAINTVNSCEKLLGVELIVQNQKGLLDFSIPQNLPDSQQHDVQLLLLSMLNGLQEISEQYPRNVRIAYSKVVE